jgi:hypothetical protein
VREVFRELPVLVGLPALLQAFPVLVVWPVCPALSAWEAEAYSASPV